MKEINIQKNLKQANSGLIIETFLCNYTFAWELMAAEQEQVTALKKG